MISHGKLGLVAFPSWLDLVSTILSWIWRNHWGTGSEGEPQGKKYIRKWPHNHGLNSYFSWKGCLEVVWSDHVVKTGLTLTQGNQACHSERIQSWRRMWCLDPWQHPDSCHTGSCLSPWWEIRQIQAAHAVFKVPCSTHEVLQLIGISL